MRAFAEGRPADCFGPAWTLAEAHVRSPRIDAGRLLLLDEVTDLDPAGGPWGRGYLRAETAVTPDDWFFAGHFKNDPCMPGTLMFEGGLQAMAFYLAALGLHPRARRLALRAGAGRSRTALRCRGQVEPGSRRIVYEVFVRGLSRRAVSRRSTPTCSAPSTGVKAFHCQRAALRLVPDWPPSPAAAAPDTAGPTRSPSRECGSDYARPARLRLGADGRARSGRPTSDSTARGRERRGCPGRRTTS